jgi:hypothetical protein
VDKHRVGRRAVVGLLEAVARTVGERQVQSDGSICRG